MARNGTRYLPPHLRGKAACHDAAAEQRALDHLQAESQVRLVVPVIADLDPSSCPLDIEPLPANGEAENGCKAFTIFLPEKMPEELLAWFKEHFSECSARLEFPTELSKLERAKWHSSAHRKGLATESRGVGDDRFLSISSQPPPEEGEAGEAVKPHLNRAQRHRAQQIYDFCQLEGGKFWDYSKGELEELVASGKPMPPDLAEMVDRRERGAKVSQLLRQGEPAEALQMLFDNPKLAWQKDEFSGGYPIHVAAWHGYRTVVEYLASLPNVIEQRDGQRETALAIAIRRGNLEIEQVLVAAGADLEHANFHREPVGLARSTHSSSEDGEKEDEYVSWNRAERRAYKHGGEGGPGRRRSMDSRRPSFDAARRASLDAGESGKEGAARAQAKQGGRRRSVDFPTTHNCPW